MKPIQVAIAEDQPGHESIRVALMAEAAKVGHTIEFVKPEDVPNAHVIRPFPDEPVPRLDPIEEAQKHVRHSHVNVGTLGRRRSPLMGALLGIASSLAPSYLPRLGPVSAPNRDRTPEEVSEIQDKRAAKELRRIKQREAARAGQNRA